MKIEKTWFLRDFQTLDNRDCQLYAAQCRLFFAHWKPISCLDVARDLLPVEWALEFRFRVRCINQNVSVLVCAIKQPSWFELSLFEIIKITKSVTYQCRLVFNSTGFSLLWLVKVNTNDNESFGPFLVIQTPKKTYSVVSCGSSVQLLATGPSRAAQGRFSYFWLLFVFWAW